MMTSGSDVAPSGAAEPEAGFVLILFLCLLAGMILAGFAAFALVQTASQAGTAPIQAPLVTYDGT